ncbi:hypothetical protein [Glycomyces buryatensis]|uniref:Uncharacterized protein n=1 Tax=Glycomyces buryatensis TaxID=2570927 RepID=A0A4S8Q976_9ACTN|nr:hypothetical protein [Glycomyces buryatensis]THV40878.1 hypothetical protein FAB82_13570 [Glycomyces buryatensis]
MTSIGDVAAILRGAMQLIEEAASSTRAAESGMGNEVAQLRASLEGSSNQLVSDGFAQWDDAGRAIEEALTAFASGNEVMDQYAASIAGGGGSGGGGLTSSIATSARIKAPDLPDDPTGMIGKPVPEPTQPDSTAEGAGQPSGAAPDSSAHDGMRIWLPGDEAYESLRNDLGDPLQPPGEIDPSDDSSFGKARRFGRGFIRGGDDLKSFGSDLASSTAGIHKGMDLPDPSGYDAATLAPEIPVMQQPPPPPGPAPNDLVGNTILMAAVFTEAGARIFDRFAGKRESRDGDTS